MMEAVVQQLAPVATPFDDTGGDRPAIVLLHGVGLSRSMWRAQVAALRPHYRVLAVDMLGHGASVMPGKDATLDDYADHVAAAMDAAAVAQATLVGFSMGALVARAFALRHPERVTALVLLNGVFARTPAEQARILARVDDVATNGPAANLDAAIERWFTPAFRTQNSDYIADLRAAFAANDPDGYKTSYRLFATQDSFGADRLAEISVPVLVATGEQDIGSTPDMARALAARIPGATLRIAADARHMMPVERPDLTNALLLDFLSTVYANTAGGA